VGHLIQRRARPCRGRHDPRLAAAVIQNPFVDGRALVAATLRSAGPARTALLVLKGLRDEARPYWNGGRTRAGGRAEECPHGQRRSMTAWAAADTVKIKSALRAAPAVVQDREMQQRAMSRWKLHM
jgi:hypothetical protein